MNEFLYAKLINIILREIYLKGLHCILKAGYSWCVSSITGQPIIDCAGFVQPICQCTTPQRKPTQPTPQICKSKPHQQHQWINTKMIDS